jgi:predicted transcriptional regulator
MPDDFTIARLNPRDATGRSDHLLNLRELVSQKENLYPGIDKWFDKQVISGIGSKRRIAYVGYLNQMPAAAAIVKLGNDSKICHISLRPDLQNIGLGELFFSLMAMEAKRQADSIHLTLPESLWNSKRAFFQSFGFTSAAVAETQYRLFDRELAARTTFSAVWNAILQKITKIGMRFSLAGNTLSGGLLFSVRPEYGNMIMNGTKTVELRRRFSKKWIGHRAVFYATEPVSGLLGQAQIADVNEGSPDKIWKRFGPAIKCGRQYYENYVVGCKNVFAISLKDPNPYVDPIFTGTLTQYTNRELTPPQSYLHLHSESGWAEAVNISVMLECLHRRLALPRVSNPPRLALRNQEKNLLRPPQDSSPMVPSVQPELFRLP